MADNQTVSKESSLPSVEPPSRRLPITTWLVLGGLGLGIVFLGLGTYMQYICKNLRWHVPGIFVTHIGAAILIATFVGLSIDRLFHHEHLKALTTSMNRSLISHEKRTRESITTAIRESAAGYELTHLCTAKEIYNEILANMEKYSYFSNTIISDKIVPPSPERIRYYEKKIELINSDKLTCREIISEALLPTMSKYFSKIIQEKSNRIAIGIVKTDQDLPDPLNFCIFHKGHDNFEEGLLMFGWVSDPKSLLVEHTCIKTNHPDLVNLFAQYFQVIERAAYRHDLKKVG